MTTTVIVSLDTSANPPVTVSTQSLVISGGGDQAIEWVPGGATPFTFESLAVLTTPNPITLGSLSDSLITATDDDEAAGTYTYRILVKSNNISYSTEKTGPTDGDPGDPDIENKKPPGRE